MRGSADVSPSTTSLFAFKPRQVLLLEQQQQGKRAVCAGMAKNRPESAIQLKPEDESVLTFSIALWLEKKGYTKVLKRFLSAAQIEDDDWKARALNLDEILSKYLEYCNGSPENIKLQKHQDEHVAGTAEKNGDGNCTEEETEGKKKKKKKKKSKGDAAVADAGEPSQDTKKNEKMNETYENDRKDQSDETSDDHNAQKSKSSNKSNDNGVSETLDQTTKKKKDKKKKENNLISQPSDAEEKKIDVVPQNPTDDGVNESKKSKKKRKRMSTDENGHESGQEVAVEESKPKKTKGLDEGKETDENAKGSLDNGIDKFNQPKSANKQKSSEPKTVTAFQRVKIEEVKFVDERLQDNSYWAKDGAETGYGAKAQEVLGQVRGRDFRHEKTKKKRGSYRGGQIDLQSHSIKFNDSDDE